MLFFLSENDMRDKNDKKSFRILVVDDDRDILELLEYNLEKEGFHVKGIDESQNAVKAALAFSPDLIILDIMMPHPNGIEICRELRSIKRFEDIYIFFLSAKSEHYYHEAALDTGGDDYIEKVIGLRALTYKVATVLKRNFVIRKSIPELKIGNLKIHRKSTSVMIDDDEITLSRPEFELLFFFAQNPRKVISQENLLQNIWGSEIYLFDTSIDVYIQSLRKKLGLDIIHRMSDNRYRLHIR
ncbi:response regulator transcription factor [Fulvivirgaceae bacterium PWU5]|uniref:Response regulator transcription factor n=1 Tax=Dawidia cretensis TaxID=2782350 RepID=A0AAP2E3T1_9BACT|nr:response regulator transcription factor [Dawidia cretensis]MBT1712045.1 response regulator transcription factor [Dawidia cretensis]